MFFANYTCILEVGGTNWTGRHDISLWWQEYSGLQLSLTRQKIWTLLRVGPVPIFSAITTLRYTESTSPHHSIKLMMKYIMRNVCFNNPLKMLCKISRLYTFDSKCVFVLWLLNEQSQEMYISIIVTWGKWSHKSSN